MPLARTVKLGPFSKGLNTALEPNLLAPDEAQENSNCDYTSGAIKGLYGPGSSVASVTAGSTFLAWAGDDHWVSSLYGDTSMNDAPTGGLGVTYKTQKTSATTATYPQVVIGANTYRLGFPAPTAAATISASTPQVAGWQRSYRYTFVTADGYETNRSPRVNYSNDNVVWLAVPTSSDSRVVKRRIYATNYNVTDTDASPQTFYYVGEITDNTTTRWPMGTAKDSPSAYPGDTTRPLNWGPGGNPNSLSLPEDHSEAPDLLLLSDTIQSLTEGAGSTGSGIIMGATATSLRWSMLGYPHYWPTENEQFLPEQPTGLITGKVHTLAFTDSAAYYITGVSDTGLSMERVSSLGLPLDAAKTLAETPWGIIWRSREGLVLFSGGEPRLISGMIAAEDLYSGDYTHAAYFDHAYHLFGAADTLVFDLRNFPAITVTRSSVVATASHVTPFDPTSGEQGLYIVDAAGAVKPWRSIDGADVPGASRLSWSHTGPKIVSSQPNGLMRLNWCHAFGDGAVTLTFYKDDGTTLHTQAFADLSTATAFRLPGTQDRGFTVKASGSGTLSALSIPLEEENGR